MQLSLLDIYNRMGSSCSSAYRFWSSAVRVRAWHRSNEMSVRLPMKLPASARCWPPHWLLPLPTQRPFDQGRNFSAWIGPGAQEAALKRGQGQAPAVSANKVTAICAACSWLARWRSSRYPITAVTMCDIHRPTLTRNAGSRPACLIDRRTRQRFGPRLAGRFGSRL